MRPFVVALNSTLYAVYAPDKQAAAQSVVRSTGTQDGTYKVELADENALELFEDEFDEALQTHEPVELDTE